jgi:hypothetical protein
MIGNGNATIIHQAFFRFGMPIFLGSVDDLAYE